jgi:pyrroloquinoline quinone (PQQ) biosynthesis protein C
LSDAGSKTILPEDEFVGRLHGIGEERYHHKHPFHQLMHEGKLTRGQLQAWALNRYAYQSRIFAAHGARESSITTAMARGLAASRNG